MSDFHPYSKKPKISPVPQNSASTISAIKVISSVEGWGRGLACPSHKGTWEYRLLFGKEGGGSVLSKTHSKIRCQVAKDSPPAISPLRKHLRQGKRLPKGQKHCVLTQWQEMALILGVCAWD